MCKYQFFEIEINDNNEIISAKELKGSSETDFVALTGDIFKSTKQHDFDNGSSDISIYSALPNVTDDNELSYEEYITENGSNETTHSKIDALGTVVFENFFKTTKQNLSSVKIINGVGVTDGDDFHKIELYNITDEKKIFLNGINGERKEENGEIYYNVKKTFEKHYYNVTDKNYIFVNKDIYNDSRISPENLITITADNGNETKYTIKRKEKIKESGEVYYKLTFKETVVDTNLFITAENIKITKLASKGFGMLDKGDYFYKITNFDDKDEEVDIFIDKSIRIKETKIDETSGIRMIRFDSEIHGYVDEIKNSGSIITFRKT